MSRKTFSPLGFFLLVLMLAILACAGNASAPPVSAVANTQVSPTQSLTVSTAVPAVPERRLLTLEFPPKIRAGDSDIVHLTLEVDTSGNITPTAVVNGNVVTGDVISIPNLYETHHVIAEARMDLAGVQISPPDLTSQTLLPGQTVTFFWSVRPVDVGLYRGTVWLYLRFVDKVSQEESRRAVSAQIVEIEAVNLFGVRANVVRVVGGVGSVVGGVIGFPFFEEIVKFVLGRRKRKK